MSTKSLEAPTMLLEEGAVTNALCTAFVCKHFLKIFLILFIYFL